MAQKFIYMSPKLVVFYHRNQEIALEDLLEKDLTIRCEILRECLHAVEQGTKEKFMQILSWYIVWYQCIGSSLAEQSAQDDCSVI